MGDAEDDWDTEVNEQPQDPFNKADFGSTSHTNVTTSNELTGSQDIEAKGQSANEMVGMEKTEESTLSEKLSETNIQQESQPLKPMTVVTNSQPHLHAQSQSQVKPQQQPQPSALVEKDQLLRAAPQKGHAFTEALSEEALAFFNEVTEKKFSEQAIAFLNAYWDEVGDQAEFIFSVAWETIKYADMHTKGINYIHQYEEGNLLDFNVGLYFYEKLCKKVLEDEDGRKWRENPEYATSMPTMMTAIVRKKELRDKVDCNFDGRISFLEYLLYQYQDEANPRDFTHRAMKQDVDEHPAITKARQALQEVNEAIRKYEDEKRRLEDLAAKPGVKGLGAKHQLAILHASPLAEQLNKSLITAEAAVRIATRKFSGTKLKASEDETVSTRTKGSIWWLNRDLQAKKELYGRKPKP